MLTNKLTGAGASDKTYIEDVFSTYLYTGNGSTQTINNGINLVNTASNQQQAIFTTPGTYTWTAPAGVTSVSVVCVGGGGGTGSSVNVGGNSYFINLATVAGYGGGASDGSPYNPVPAAGGSYVGDGGGNGGSSSYGGGGAGGYAGTGGAGSNVGGNAGSDGTGGGGGGGSGPYGNPDNTGGGGGGVGLLGQGTDGAGGVTPTSGSSAGKPGSGGSGGFGGNQVNGGAYGGGGGGNYGSAVSAYIAGGGGGGLGYKNNITVVPGNTYTVVVGNAGVNTVYNGRGAGVGGGGAVRIVWPGTTRQFPSTDVGTLADPAKGGMVWLKGRSGATDHALYDTNRGATKDLVSNTTGAETTQSTGLTAFNSNGFSTGSLAKLNTSSATYASWTFRKAPKFFDVVTYTGDGTSSRSIPHSLGSVPGMIIVKCTSTASNWTVYHRSASENLYLNTSDSGVGGLFYISGNSTSTNIVLGTNATGVNSSGATYVAYLFAHDTTTDGLIQCGSLAGAYGSTVTVTLPWEPQFLLVKAISGGGNWRIFDVMRGWDVSNANDKELFSNLSTSESAEEQAGNPIANGFTFKCQNNSGVSGNYIYMAIRRGPMRTPTVGTKVFKPVARIGNSTTTTLTSAGFPVDLFITQERTNYGYVGALLYDRLRGATITLGSKYTSAESSVANTVIGFDAMSGVKLGNDPVGYGVNTSGVGAADWNFKRAPGFFDVVCYTGTGSGTQTVSHNLGVKPQLIIVKRRDTAGTEWRVYAEPMTAAYYAKLHLTDAFMTNSTWLNTEPTSTVFSVSANGAVGASGGTYVAYLFASCPGVSKVGSFTGNGTSQTINCGFTNGARFVLIKQTNSTGDWYVWDTARGIVASTDPHLSLNTNAAEVTTDDTIDPDSTGFIVNQVTATNVNVSGGSYIYLAIA